MNRTIPAALAAVSLAASLATAAAAEERPAVALKAEACLRQNVDRVVAADPNMASAADFLVNYACADEVATLVRYQRNLAYVAIFSVVGRSNPPAPASGDAPKPPPPPPIDPKALVDPVTGDLKLPPSPPGSPSNGVATLLPMLNGLTGQLIAVSAPPELRRLAGELVLAAHARAKTAKH
jgi:hypothetical protein